MTVQQHRDVRDKLGKVLERWQNPELSSYESLAAARDEIVSNGEGRGREIFDSVQWAASEGTIRKDGKPVTVYRGIGVDNNETKKLYDNLMDNETFTFSGLGSTSYDPVIPRRFYGRSQTRIFFKIKATSGVGVSRNSNLPGEMEVVLPKGAEYRVVGRKLTKRDPENDRSLYLEVELEEDI